MAWRVVKQPNGHYAIFSDVVDNFTYMNLTCDEVIATCTEMAGKAVAESKLKNADEDEVLLGKAPEGTPVGRRRWMHSLGAIRIVHGKKAEAEAIKNDAEYKPGGQ